MLINLKTYLRMPDLKTQDGYMQRFWELVQENNSCSAPMRKALISLESELLSRYGVRRYSSYDSFSAAKSRGPAGIRLTIVQSV